MIKTLTKDSGAYRHTCCGHSIAQHDFGKRRVSCAHWSLFRGTKNLKAVYNSSTHYVQAIETGLLCIEQSGAELRSTRRDGWDGKMATSRVWDVASRNLSIPLTCHESNRLQGAAPGTCRSDCLTLEEDVSLRTGEGNTKSSLNFGSPRRTLYLVDVHPLCYEGKKPRPTAILNWIKLLFDDVSHADPVIAVMDGEKGNEYRRGLLPAYKAKRNAYRPLSGVRGPYFKGDEMDLRKAFPHVKDFLMGCNVPVLKMEDAEADDVIATLAHQAIKKDMRVVVASPDMDFRQLLSENVNMVLPLPEFGRWSFYTLQQYIAEHDCEPSSDLGLRCMLGDQSDSVPGLPEWAPGFGRKTALKLLKKHGSLENLLLAAKTRTVGKPYIQEALSQHRDALYRNLQVLSFRRDVDITLKEEWCRPRNRTNEAVSFRKLREYLQEKQYISYH